MHTKSTHKYLLHGLTRFNNGLRRIVSRYTFRDVERTRGLFIVYIE
jgi:hypothetical protein